MNFFQWPGIAAFALMTPMLVACASKPGQLHTLTSGDAAPTAKTTTAYAIALGPVSVPRGVDIPQLIIIQSDGSARLAENQRWMAPLADEIRAALSQQIQARLGVADLSGVSAATGLRVYVIRVDVQRFESLPDGSVSVVAAWSLRDAAATHAAASCVARVREANVAADYVALVQGYRRAIAAVAAHVSGGIAALEKDPATFVCLMPAP